MRPTVRAVLGIVFFSVGLAASLHAAMPQDSNAPDSAYPVQGVVIVKFRERPAVGGLGKTGFKAVDRALLAHGVEAIEPIAPWAPAPRKAGGVDISRIFTVHYASGVAPHLVAAELARFPEVEYAEVQRVYPLCVNPNDTRWSTQDDYLAAKMQFPAAWDTVKCEQGDVVIAIVDGGTFWNHRDLLPNVWSNTDEIAGNGVDDDSNGFIDDVRGWNFANNTNDPTGLANTPLSGRHGTHTAGIACAVTNNTFDIAGASWNAKLMAINAASPTQDSGIQFGYTGILYAAANGADIINCSWGGVVSPSAYEMEVIDFAEEHGASVVAAAGNQGGSDSHYPSSYTKVLSVANVTNTDARDGSSNYGPDVDVCAQGRFILSLYPNNATASLSGTSMSSPHAAAIAALVRTQNPGWTPQQVLQQVRVTCDDIDGLNPGYGGLLGKGRVNALRALTVSLPAVRVDAVTVQTPDDDGVIERGERIQIHVDVKNHLAEAANITFTLTEASDETNAATIVDGSDQLAGLASGEAVALEPFVVDISGSAAEQTTIRFRLDISSGAPVYNDVDAFDIVVLPVFVNHIANNVATSVTSNGRLGFAITLGGNGSDGIGFVYKSGGNMLFEGGLMIGDGPTRVVNAVRSSNPNNPPDNDFRTAPNGVPVAQVNGADQVSAAQFNDFLANPRFNMSVVQQGFQFADAPDADYVVLRYTLMNNGAVPWNNLYIGWFFDWDIDAASFATNRTGFDATRGLGYVWDSSGGAGGAYAGVRVLSSPGATSYRGIYNDNASPNNPTGWGLYDGYTDAEKWQSLSGGIVHTSLGPADISNAIATGPFSSIAPGESLQVGIAFVGGDDLVALQANADAALLKWPAIQNAPVAVEILDLAARLDGHDVLVSWRTGSEENVAGFRVLRSRDGGPVEVVSDVLPHESRQYAVRDVAPEPGHYLYRIAEVSTEGNVVLHAGVEIEVLGSAPRRTFLAPAEPNPFNPSTTLRFELASPGPAHLIVYDARGRRVRTLAAERFAQPGRYEARWDGLDDNGRSVASGVYHARLEVTGRVFTQRLTLIK